MSIVAYRIPHLNNVTCVVVGLGLIGQAVSSHLNYFGLKVELPNNQKVDWRNSHSILSAIRLLSRKSDERLELIWCAGAMGFSANNDQLGSEHQIFKEVVERLSVVHSDLAISFMSSAGGVFEGSGGVCDISDPVAPIRPYGEWKIKQEEFLQTTVEVARIYRISSVYGVSSRKSRQGIVNALVGSAYTNEPAVIHARASTLRDYVSNLDVGKYVVSQLAVNSNLIEIVASGRPTSIDILANLVKRATRRNLRVSYRPSLENNRDIVFSKKALPRALKCSSLEEGILNLSANYRAIKFGSR
jgi:hypothetical protein